MRFALRIIFILLLPIVANASELQVREEIENSVKALFISENFELLNSTGSSYLTNQERTSSGLWKLTLFYVGIASIPNSKVIDPEYWSSLKDKAIRWSKVDKNASFAHMVYVDILISEAWMYRGGGVASSVRKEDWQPFREKIEEARQYLLNHDQYKNTDPRWYEKMLTIAKAQSWSTEQFYTLLDEALSVHPKYYELYFRAINYLQPKWHGSAEEIEVFATYAIEKSQAYEGHGMYARIYWYVSQVEYGMALFTESVARWEQMRLGIEDVIKKYPDQWNINNFALFACLAGDNEMTEKLMSMLNDRPIISVWKSGKLYDYCESLGDKKASRLG
ncbi:MAG: DUF4034 domain-containing protein [Sedimenticola sp.]|nr:DUF4034 domain-containing protein [Sedimenticola sp.]